MRAHDSGSTFEGTATVSASFERFIEMDEILAASHAAIRATVAIIHPSELNTRSGGVEVSEDQVDSPDPSVFPTFDVRTRIDLDVIKVLGVRPASPIEVGDRVTIDAAGGAITLALPIETARPWRLYSDVGDIGAPGSFAPPARDTIEVTLSQRVNLSWNEGEETIAFIAQNDVVVATWTDGRPELRTSTIVTYDPAGSFILEGDVAYPNRTITEIAEMAVEELDAIAAQLSTTSKPAAPMD
ncbi:MAG: hypothetical protein H0U21_16800 [Acidimicrobiia bacterium]|nr:hypothetical protein [Acidimicrobiia bacterium]